MVNSITEQSKNFISLFADSNPSCNLYRFAGTAVALTAVLGVREYFKGGSDEKQASFGTRAVSVIATALALTGAGFTAFKMADFARMVYNGETLPKYPEGWNFDDVYANWHSSR